MKAGGWIGGQHGLCSAPVTAPAPSPAAQYVRMSSEHQQYSPKNELEIIRRYAAAHNILGGIPCALQSMHNQTDARRILHDAASIYKVDIEAITAQVKREFFDKNKQEIRGTTREPSAKMPLKPTKKLQLRQ